MTTEATAAATGIAAVTAALQLMEVDPPAIDAQAAARSREIVGQSVWSVHTSSSEAALKAASPFVVWDFHAPVGSKLNSVLGLAGVYDTGQLTSSAV